MRGYDFFSSVTMLTANRNSLCACIFQQVLEL